MLVPVLLLSPKGEFTSSVIVGALIIVIFGFIDDRRELGYKSKFAGQCIAALVVILHGGVGIRSLGTLLPAGTVLPPWLAVPLTLVVIVGITNAFNLSDGLDGLAGGISLLCFSCIAILAYQLQEFTIAVFAVAIVGAIFAFLRFNTYPAVIFMGDAGSLLLGFLAATLSLGLTQGGHKVSPLFPMLLLGLPALDTMTVMITRLAEGRSPFVADKNHFHHKLIRAGLRHWEAVSAIYLLQAVLVAVAYTLRFSSDGALLCFYGVFAGVLSAWFVVIEKTGWQVRRNPFIEQMVKHHLQVLKEKAILIKVAYWFVLLFLPGMLIFSALLPAEIPAPFASLSLCWAGMLFLVMLFRPGWLEITLRLALFYLIPLLVYLYQCGSVGWLDYRAEKIYNISFLLLVGFVICMLKLTRRQNGFRTTPTDFLILFIALIVPNLPDAQMQSYRMGLFAAKLIAFFFSYEVLVGELRGELNGLGLTTIATLLVVYARGIL
jgi:UDP-GlcNAc:undecaprenyl-phosphate GlcNAc-1-phosphate transferase